jgi:hypothetical protein
VDAINGARVFLLVFSSNANESSQIKREVERAINRGIPIVPFRIENVVPTKSLEYFLSTPHWLDAFSPPLEQHLSYLSTVISNILGSRWIPSPEPFRTLHAAKEPPTINRRWLIGGGGLATAGLLAGGYFLFGSSRSDSFAGSWTAQSIDFGPDVPSPFAIFSINSFYEAALAGKNVHATFSLGDVGDYRFSWGGEDAGIVNYAAQKAEFLSDLTRRNSAFSYTVLSTPPANVVSFLGGHDGQAAISLSSPGTSLSMLVGTSQGPGLTGEWTTNTAATPTFDATRTSLNVSAQGRYRYQFDFSESGTFQAANGIWTRTRQGAQPQSGNYKFESQERVTATGNGITIVWQRST